MSTYTILMVLHEAGFTWQASRTWCETGKVKRKRKSGGVEVTDPDAEPKKLIEQAYQTGEKLGLPVWTTDQAGPFQTVPIRGIVGNARGSPNVNRMSTFVTAPPSC